MVRWPTLTPPARAGFAIPRVFRSECEIVIQQQADRHRGPHAFQAGAQPVSQSSAPGEWGPLPNAVDCAPFGRGLDGSACPDRTDLSRPFFKCLAQAGAGFRCRFARSRWCAADFSRTHTSAHWRHLSAIWRHATLLSGSHVNSAIHVHSEACFRNSFVRSIYRDPPAQ